MRQYIATLESVARYSQSRNYEMDSPKAEKESSKDYENRTWRERCHAGPDGYLFIPPTAFKESLTAAAKYLGMQIPGKGKNTYTKHFTSGVIISDGIRLDVKKSDVLGEWLYLNSDGQKGGSKRVWRCMPYVETWIGDLALHVLDDTITEDVLRYHLEQCGVFVGIGRFRPAKNGYYGRFRIKELEQVT